MLLIIEFDDFYSKHVVCSCDRPFKRQKTYSLVFIFHTNTLCYWMDIRSPPSSKKCGIGSPTPDRKSFSLLKDEQQENQTGQFRQLVLALSENVSRDSLTNLRNWLNHNPGIDHADAQTASTLVDLLIRAIGKRESKVKGQLNQDSQLALVVLFEYEQRGTHQLIFNKPRNSKKFQTFNLRSIIQ